MILLINVWTLFNIVTTINDQNRKQPRHKCVASVDVETDETLLEAVADANPTFAMLKKRAADKDATLEKIKFLELMKQKI